MRKFTSFILLMLIGLSLKSWSTTPQVKSSTAWFNNENFESFTAGTDLKTAGTSAYSDWTGTNVMAGIMQLSANPTTSSASNLVFGFPTGTTLATTFGDGGTSGTLNITKNAFTGGALTGYVYLKTSFYFQTYGCYYVLKNAAGNEVFRFGGRNGTSNAIYCTGLDYTTVGLGVRNNWGDIECVLDLNNKLIKKVTFTYNGGTGSPKSWSDIALTNGENVSSLYLSVSRRSGLDNTTIGQLNADNIQNITANQTNHQTTNGSVSTTLNVTPISTIMGLALPFTGANTDVDVTWSISDWGTMSEADKALVEITRSATDYSTATLTTSGSISADADITVSASVADGAVLTKVINLKSNSIDGVKSTLLSEITAATDVRNAVTDVNPYINNLKSDLNAVINAGQSVYDNAASTINDVTSATTNLVSSKSVFTSGMLTYTTYVDYINTVKAGRDTVGLKYPAAAFFPALKATLNLGITAAETAKGTVTSNIDIASATTELTAAYAIFNTDRPAFYTLGSQIATVTTRYNAVLPRKGDSKFLQFSAASVDALAAAMNNGNIILNTATSAVELTTETTTLATALTTFNSTDRIAPSTDMYRIFSYGSSGGDGDGVKKVLFAHKINNTPAYRLAWCNLTNARTLSLGDSALWLITETAANKYTVKNKALDKYLLGTSFVDAPTDYLFSEVKSQNGYINGFIDWSTKQIADPKFIYAMVSGNALEIRADSVAPYSNLRTGSAADRYRFAFQFEEAVAPAISTTESNINAFACNVGATDIKSLTLAGDNLYDAQISLSITGANAEMFTLSAASISPVNTYLRNQTVSITYTPTTSGLHVAKLTIAATGGNSLEYDLSGSVITSVVDNNSFSKLVYIANGKINFNANAGEQVEIFNAVGVKLFAGKTTEGLNSIHIPTQGVLIVKIGNQTNKVIQ